MVQKELSAGMQGLRGPALGAELARGVPGMQVLCGTVWDLHCATSLTPVPELLG